MRGKKRKIRRESAGNQRERRRKWPQSMLQKGRNDQRNGEMESRRQLQGSSLSSFLLSISLYRNRERQAIAGANRHSLKQAVTKAGQSSLCNAVAYLTVCSVPRDRWSGVIRSFLFVLYFVDTSSFLVCVFGATDGVNCCSGEAA